MNDALAGPRQSRLLHRVCGAEPKDLHGAEFRGPGEPDIAGRLVHCASADAAWRAKARPAVDHGLTRLFIPHLPRFLEPASDGA